MGEACQPAHHLRLNGLRQAAFPFDWICTPPESLINILQSKFEGFFDKENIFSQGIIHQTGENYINKKYNFVFVHDFKNAADFEDNFNKVKEKYERRIQRFYQALTCSSKIYFIRHKMPKDKTILLNDFLIKNFPNLEYNLLIIDDTEEIKQGWHIKNVINCYMQTAPFNNATDPKFNAAWANFFKTYIK